MLSKTAGVSPFVAVRRSFSSASTPSAVFTKRDVLIWDFIQARIQSRSRLHGCPTPKQGRKKNKTHQAGKLLAGEEDSSTFLLGEPALQGGIQHQQDGQTHPPIH